MHRPRGSRRLPRPPPRRRRRPGAGRRRPRGRRRWVRPGPPRRWDAVDREPVGRLGDGERPVRPRARRLAGGGRVGAGDGAGDDVREQDALELVGREGLQETLGEGRECAVRGREQGEGPGLGQRARQARRVEGVEQDREPAVVLEDGDDGRRRSVGGGVLSERRSGEGREGQDQEVTHESGGCGGPATSASRAALAMGATSGRGEAWVSPPGTGGRRPGARRPSLGGRPLTPVSARRPRARCR